MGIKGTRKNCHLLLWPFILYSVLSTIWPVWEIRHSLYQKEKHISEPQKKAIIFKNIIFIIFHDAYNPLMIITWKLFDVIQNMKNFNIIDRIYTAYTNGTLHYLCHKLFWYAVYSI